MVQLHIYSRVKGAWIAFARDLLCIQFVFAFLLVDPRIDFNRVTIGAKRTTPATAHGMQPSLLNKTNFKK